MSNYGNDDNDHDDYDINEMLMFYGDDNDGCLPWWWFWTLMSKYGNDDNDHDDYDIIECLCITVTVMMVACRGHDSQH
jgi:hypothetical protein